MQTAPKPAFKPLDVFDLQWVSDPQVSPDGRSIAYVRMSFDIKTDRPRGVIWLVGADGKTCAASCRAPRRARRRVGRPMARRLAYLGTGADGSTQLFVYWTESGVDRGDQQFYRIARAVLRGRRTAAGSHSSCRWPPNASL